MVANEAWQTPFIDTTDRSLIFVTAEQVTLRVVLRFSLETDATMAFDAIWRAKKQRTLPTLPRREGKSPGLAYC